MRGERSCVCGRQRDTDRDTKSRKELSPPREPAVNPGINELKIKQRALGGKMQNSVRRTTSGDESALKPVPDSQTGELKFSSSRKTWFRQGGSKMPLLVTVEQI